VSDVRTEEMVNGVYALKQLTNGDRSNRTKGR